MSYQSLCLIGDPRIKTPRIILVVILALTPLFAANMAMAQSQQEYNAIVEAAKAKLSAAQTALATAQLAYQSAIDLKATADRAVASAQGAVVSVLANQLAKQALVNSAQEALALAKSNYDTLLIADPSWIRPNIDKTITVDVPYTVQVPHTETITTTTRVAHTTYTTIGGITADVFNRRGYNAAPPLPSSIETPYATSTVSNIDFQWGGGYVMNTNLSEDVIVRFTGGIVVPTTETYYFYTPADDGTILDLNGTRIIYDWRDKGGGGLISQGVNLTAGIVYPFTLYFYENGGGAWVQFNVSTDASNWQVVPTSWLGTQVQEITTYEDVVTTHEVTTYTEETLYRKEDKVINVPDEDATAPLINDPELVAPIDDAQDDLSSAQSDLASANQKVTEAQSDQQQSIDIQAEKASIISVASSDVATRQQELNVAQQELEAIPPFREPTPTTTPSTEPTKEPTETVIQPLPEPESSETPKPTKPELPVNVETVDPKTLSDEEVEQLVVAAEAILATSEQGSPAYEEALQALAVAAIADDPVLPEALSSIPGAEAVLETFNALGNIGADMAPAVREEAKKTVIASVIAAGTAVNATMMAASTSTTSTGSTGGSSSGGSGASETKTSTRRREV